MGLQADIGYTPRQPNAAQRAIQKLFSTRAGTAAMIKVVPSLDRLMYRYSKGRLTVVEVFAALPVVLLTTTGVRSGVLRTSPLNAIPIGKDLAVIGTNFGTGKIPGWAFNLRAHPIASIESEGRSVAVAAREASPAEYEAAFATAIRIYPGYAGYRARATNPIPVFVLASGEAG